MPKVDFREEVANVALAELLNERTPAVLHESWSLDSASALLHFPEGLFWTPSA